MKMKKKSKLKGKKYSNLSKRFVKWKKNKNKRKK